jgi:hypothetical protein
METYLQMKGRQRQELDSLPIKWAFNNEQFEQGLTELGLTRKDIGTLVKVPGGGFCTKNTLDSLLDMLDRHGAELRQAIEKDETGENFIAGMFGYELANHEYIITFDAGPALRALGLSDAEINSNPALLAGLQKARMSQTEHA